MIKDGFTANFNPFLKIVLELLNRRWVFYKKVSEPDYIHLITILNNQQIETLHKKYAE